MSRRLALGLYVLRVALVVVGAIWGSLWIYLEYETHRARLMLLEVSRIRIGDPEDSVLPVVQRYGGFKRAPNSLGSREDWIDKEEYDYQENRLGDYGYEFGVSPFGTTMVATSRFTGALRKVRTAVPARLRALLGMRDWGAVIDLSIRGGRVRSVSVMTLFAGHSGWLGHSWALAEGMPRHNLRPRAYIIGGSFLTMGDGPGMMIQNYITPRASEAEGKVARQLNTRCLTSVKGCDGLCDVAPDALRYLEQHPDADWDITPKKCP